MASIVVGGHFGDEGKGKIVSYLALNDKPAVIARAGVGPNAGHTVYKSGKKYGLRMIPCGFVYEDARLLIGAGVLVDPNLLLKELELTGTQDRFALDRRCGIIEAAHKKLDSSDFHLTKSVATTGTGCGPANADRAMRKLKHASEVPELKKYLTDVPLEINNAVDEGKDVLVEASQGFGLSLFYGAYPNVTSKDTSASMAAVDVGLGPTKISEVIVVYKAYMSRVGAGSQKLPTLITKQNLGKYPELKATYERALCDGTTGKDVNEVLARYLGEAGTVTGRLRQICGFDYELAKYSAMVNGATQVAVTCLDKVFPECSGVRDYSGLPKNVRDYIAGIEKEVGVNVTFISTGPDADDIIDLR